MKKKEKKPVRVKWVEKNGVGGGKKNQRSNQDCVCAFIYWNGYKILSALVCN